MKLITKTLKSTVLIAVVTGIAFTLFTNRIVTARDSYSISNCHIVEESKCTRNQQVSSITTGWPYETHTTAFNEPGHNEFTSSNQMAYIPVLGFETPIYGFWGNFIIFTLSTWLILAIIRTYLKQHS